MQTNHPFYSPDAGDNQSQTPTEELRYAHLPLKNLVIGYDLRCISSQPHIRIKAIFLDEEGKAINANNPFIFSEKLIDAIDPSNKVNAITIENNELIAEFDFDQFMEHRETLRLVLNLSSLDWNNLKASDNDAGMNPIGEPPRKG